MALKGKRMIFADSCVGKVQERAANEAGILPGSLVKDAATGFDQSTDAAAVFGAPTLIADYNFLQAGSVDDAYALGDQVYARVLGKDEYANVLVASGQNITALNTPLTRNGDGSLKIAATDGSEAILCYANEIINTGASAQLVSVRGE